MKKILSMAVVTAGILVSGANAEIIKNYSVSKFASLGLNSQAKKSIEYMLNRKSGDCLNLDIQNNLDKNKAKNEFVLPLAGMFGLNHVKTYILNEKDIVSEVAGKGISFLFFSNEKLCHNYYKSLKK